MTAEAANRLNVAVSILDQEGNPASQVTATAPHVIGNFRDADRIMDLATRSTVLTVEIEHVDTHALQRARDEGGVSVQPSPETIRIIQDKYAQKVHLQKHGVPLPEYLDVSAGDAGEVDALRKAGAALGYPLMLKAKTFAYDGRGNRVVRSEKEISDAVKDLGGGKAAKGPELYAEKWVEFEREIAVMVARGLDGAIASYPCVETVQLDSICHVVIAPAQIDGLMAQKAISVAETAIASFDGAGVYGVEMFLLRNGKIILNEIAPRPHNSGHYTIEACHTSQFEQHVRTVVGMPLGSTAMKVPAAAMLNILGVGSDAAAVKATMAPVEAAMTVSGASVHWYGKAEVRAGRKMGHVTVVGDTMPEVMSRLRTILSAMPEGRRSAGEMNIAPVVGIIMGSDSDLPTMKAAATILKEFDVPFEITIVSAHRTPRRMVDYAEQAHRRGLKVIIAAAGGAAHLPGMVAALTPLPVIGVPVALKQLDGVDSLYSIVQMPRGVPVATVAINNSTNAALLAVRILGSSAPGYLDKIVEYRQRSENEVLGKVEKLQSTGWEKYELPK
ncbi:phosphoribosylaminoimidazole carboxylase ade2 [Irineochytrium annulatum]|nr:phosphoribosylaminoimidazole carboxylase ade2 [Irineochytrium annulatum]